MYPLPVFNCHEVCTICGKVACPNCAITDVECNTKKGSHQVQICVVHSDVVALKNLIRQYRQVMTVWDLKPLKPESASPSIPRTIQSLLVKCPDTTVRRDPIQPTLLCLDNNLCNEKAFQYLCESGNYILAALSNRTTATRTRSLLSEWTVTTQSPQKHAQNESYTIYNTLCKWW